MHIQVCSDHNTEGHEAMAADRGRVCWVRPLDGGDAGAVLAEFTRIGVNDSTLAAQLQREGTAAFDASWKDRLGWLASIRSTLRPSDHAMPGMS